MRLLNKIPGIYRKPDIRKAYGIVLAILSLLAGLFLVSSSAWFITSTALTGMGLNSLQGYNMFLPGAAIRFLAIAKPLARYKERVYTHQITLRILSSSRVWVFDKILHLKKDGLVKFRSAELLNGLVADIDEMDHFYLGVIIPWYSAGFAFLLAGIFFLIVLPPLFWLATAAFLIAGILIPWRAYKAGNIQEEKGMALQTRLHTDLITLLTAFADLRIFGLLGRRRAMIERQVQDREKIRRQSGIRLAGWVLLQNLVLQSCLVVAIWLLYQNIGRLYGPLMVLIVLSLIALFETLQPLTALGHQFSRTAWAGSRLNQWLQAGSGDQGGAPIDPVFVNIFPTQHSITLSHLDFSYGSRVILFNRDFVFPANALTVITGANGAGKSTLLDLVSGLRIPAKGQIAIGNIPLNDLDRNELLEKIGYMEQQVNLFHASIYENIAMAKQDVSEPEVLEAAVQAGLGRYIEQSPEFLQTDAGESGKNLSGGQARMIAFARIILKDAPILLLDEPTEGLDSHAEQRMIELILSWKKNKTIVLATHKRSVLSIADYHLAL